MITELDKELRFMFDKPETCSNCIGHGFCCQRSACNCYPSDFDNDICKMEEALITGKYAIDFTRSTPNAFIWKGMHLTLDIEHILHTAEEALYMRPRNRDRPVVDIIHVEEDEYEGPCVLWSYEKGCKLSYEERPMFGRHMIASENPLMCISFYDIIEESGMKKKLIEGWKPYTRDVFRLAQKFFDRNWKYYRKFSISLCESNIG